MKKNIVLLITVTMLVASCGTYTGAGAGTGAYWGSWVGSAIGGLSGGHRGYHVGQLLGMAGGAVVGAAIGSAQDQARQDDMEQYQAEKARLAANRRVRQNQQTVTTTVPEGYSFEQGAIQDSGFDSNNGGDDRIELDLGDDTQVSASGEISADALSGVSSQVESIGGAPVLEIRNARFVDANGDNCLSRGENATIVFEIHNSGNATAYDLQPTVIETTGNKHILVSPSILIENLGPGKGVRYTARVVADKSLKEGMSQFSVAIVQGTETASKVVNFTVPTHK